MLLGGFAAESIIFGEDNVTTGAVSDIHKATLFACHMFKNCGMGGLPASIHQEDAMTKYFLHDNDFSINEDIKTIIMAGYTKAEQTIIKYKSLLLQMSDYLSDNRTLKKDQITGMLGKYSDQFDSYSIIEDGSHLFYRDHLKKMVNTRQEKQLKPSLPEGEFGYSMNRK